MEPRIDVFFYGSFMSLDVLRGRGFVPATWRTAVVVGYKLVFRPYATLDRAPGEVVYGIICSATHDELRALYAAESWLSGYEPEAVLVHANGDAVSSALCFVAHGAGDTSPSADYIRRIADAARQHRFPEWYIQQIVRAGDGR